MRGRERGREREGGRERERGRKEGREGEGERESYVCTCTGSLYVTSRNSIDNVVNTLNYIRNLFGGDLLSCLHHGDSVLSLRCPHMLSGYDLSQFTVRKIRLTYPLEIRRQMSPFT